MNVCQRCPSGAERCYSDQIVVEKGHWRISNTAEVIPAYSTSAFSSCAAVWSDLSLLCSVWLCDFFSPFLRVPGETIAVRVGMRRVMTPAAHSTRDRCAQPVTMATSTCRLAMNACRVAALPLG